MTHLRKIMLEELERRNYAQTTTTSYIQTIEDFARYFKRPPDQLGPEHIREYQAYLFREKKLARQTVTQRLAALRFFFIQTLKKPWSVAETPYPKKTRHLPTILSPEEVAHLIDSARTQFHRVLLMTLYGTGARRAELCKPKLWLFPGGCHHAANRPISPKTVWHACHRAAQHAGLQDRVHPHTLRHCFATHLLENGADLRTIQILLGHRDLKETTIYLHLSQRHLHATASPLDSLSLKGISQPEG